MTQSEEYPQYKCMFKARIRQVIHTGCFIISVLIIRFNRANSLYDIIINYAPFSSTLNNIFICTMIWELFDVMA